MRIESAASGMAVIGGSSWEAFCEGLAGIVPRAHNFRDMNPLDLSNAPPRPPHAELDGIVFLPRSVDKARAHLPGGNRNSYNVSGLTTTMLERFGIAPDDFVAAVGAAATEADVVAFVRRHVSQATIEEWNARVKLRQPRGDRNLPEVFQSYPWLGERPDLMTAMDILVEDDRRFFAPST